MGGVGWQISGDFRKLRKVEGAGGGGEARIVTGESQGIAATEKAEQESQCLKTVPVVALFPQEQSLEVLPPPSLRQRNPEFKHVTR